MQKPARNPTPRATRRPCFDAIATLAWLRGLRNRVVGGASAACLARTGTLRVAALAGGAFFLSSVALAADDGTWQPTAEIERAAADHLKSLVGSEAGNTDVLPDKLDSRLRLKRCDTELEGFLRPGVKVRERTVVGVRCTGSSPWKVYIPVDLVVTESVLVPRRSLGKGHIIAAADLVADERDVSRLHSGYFTNRKQLVGQRVRQPLVAGRIITPRMIEADLLIRRGQSVTLSVSNDRLNIRMSGKALSDAALGQRIKVENTNSGRIVEGVVRSREHVEILVAGTNGNF